MKVITFNLCFCGLLFLTACQSTDTSQIDKLTNELIQAKTEIASLKSADDLVHIVYFKLKEDASKKGLIAEIKKLKNIEVLDNLEVGVFEDLGDSRAMSDYDVMMQMEFENEEDYKTYQAHPIHLALKKAVGAYLAGPPVTYDYWEK